MKIKLVCVGKIKDSWIQQGISEYSTRISKYSKIEIIEVLDVKDDIPEEQAKTMEAERLFKHIGERSCVIVCDLKGKSFTSEAWADTLSDFLSSGASDYVFVIGGSRGLSNAIIKRADLTWSFSALTFPHQLFRVLLLEQIYRAFKIMKNETYHK